MRGARGVWAAYALSALAMVAVLALVGHWVVAPGFRAGVRAAALAAWLLQLIAFAGLLAVRGRPELFLTGFVGGMLLRLGVVLGAALWLRATQAYPPLPTMIAFVVFLFVLLLLEAGFVRKGQPGG